LPEQSLYIEFVALLAKQPAPDRRTAPTLAATTTPTATERATRCCAAWRIETVQQAEDILRNGRVDLVFIGRELLKDPFWARTAADDLRSPIQPPAQYTRYGSAWRAHLGNPLRNPGAKGPEH
jgi:2,4-dienoyl-CoA reductase-like NADH-dependent reductase (Old Yellow Enzyme family)